jgi:hypothetical protein
MNQKIFKWTMYYLYYFIELDPNHLCWWPWYFAHNPIRCNLAFGQKNQKFDPKFILTFFKSWNPLRMRTFFEIVHQNGKVWTGQVLILVWFWFAINKQLGLMCFYPTRSWCMLCNQWLCQSNRNLFVHQEIMTLLITLTWRGKKVIITLPNITKTSL